MDYSFLLILIIFQSVVDVLKLQNPAQRPPNVAWVLVLEFALLDRENEVYAIWQRHSTIESKFIKFISTFHFID